VRYPPAAAMTDNTFSSSDAVRSGRPLAHAQSLTLPGPHRLELGAILPAITVCFEVFGTLTPARDNVVLVCHALSGDSHVTRHTPDDDPGWWEDLIGPGRHLDTNTLAVVCANVLGGCRGTTGPASPDPAGGQPWADRFPTITVGDMVMVQALLLDHLRIARLVAVVGGSMGGMVAMALATMHPERVGSVVLLATAARLGAQALAFDVVARNAILSDPDFHGGRYYNQPRGPETGLAIARMLGHITYLSREAMAARFDAERLRPRPVDTPFEVRFAVGSYLAYQGGRFVERFDANSYLRLSLALGLFDLGATTELLARAFAASHCPWLVVSFSTDWLFPPEQSAAMVRALITAGRPVSHVEISTRAGHDAFLLEPEINEFGPLIAAFLACRQGRMVEPHNAPPAAPTAVHARRSDLDRILELIPAGAGVLDLGCGSGALLARLKARGDAGRLLGVELDLRAITAAVSRGLDVVQGDLNHGLEHFATGQFDVVVLSHTLQAVVDVERLLGEMVRVGRLGIVSFANLGHWRHREALAHDGRAPVLAAGREWSNAPVLRPCSIADFCDACSRLGIRVVDLIGLDGARGVAVRDDANRRADTAVAVISRF
jgi:homoserine O-acetyltransferase